METFQPKLVNEKDLSQLIGRSIQTLRNDRLLNRGIPYIRVGGSVRYSLTDVDRYLESHRVETDDAGLVHEIFRESGR